MEKKAIFLLLCCVKIITTFAQNNQNNNTLEDEKYWQRRAKEAEIRNKAAYHPNPFNVTNHLNLRARMTLEKGGLNSTRRILAKKYRRGCLFTNPIDECWRCRPNWANNRKRLAKCALGFGIGTTGGILGERYTVTDSSDNDMVNPKPGTLRYAVTRDEPLWIIFSTHMTIRLNQELIIASNKTIDGRGANVIIEGGAGLTLQFVENVIVHGLKIRNIVPGSGGMIRDSANHFGFRTMSDGDAISIFGSHHIWIDHCSFSNSADGLIDAIQGSTAITISNCHMTNHDKAFLFGARDTDYMDRKMQITIAYTHFGKGMVQRMPRCRWGFFHVVNNDYTHWVMYAIGGSQNPTIISEGNRFIAPYNDFAKEVTHRINPNSPWDSGTWTSREDILLNGATFKQSGTVQQTPPPEKMIKCIPGRFTGRMTRFAGPLKCIPNMPC
ncbi:hypothetical protein RND81_02G224900 [Saponaria officinalis]|uniref:Pectate lyase n=1 Tax=Saponaria officinalis TaxID=3572 RepID=A0AAW1MY29_SAPOF